MQVWMLDILSITIVLKVDSQILILGRPFDFKLLSREDFLSLFVGYFYILTNLTFPI